MSHYVSVKVTDCTPEQRDGVDGFRVTYEDGYVSWCPKMQHGRDYVPIGWLHHCSQGQRRTMAFSVLYEERIKELEGILNDGDLRRINANDLYMLENELKGLKNLVSYHSANVGAMLIRQAKEDD